MSYYGIRKLKTFQDVDGTWNFSCDVYDSSIWSWDNKRVWEHLDRWFKHGLNTKEELERFLFENTLDGNLHGTGGKYSYISWGNCRISLSDKEKAIIEELEKKYQEVQQTQRDLALKLRKGIQYSYTELNENNAEFRALSDELDKLSKEKRQFRYDSYFKRWKQYLAKQNENRKIGKVYAVKLDFNGYNNVYVSSHGTAQTVFKYNIYYAKLFTKSIEELKEMFCNNPKYTNIEFLDVTNYVTGKGRSRHAQVDWKQEQELERVKC